MHSAKLGNLILLTLLIWASCHVACTLLYEPRKRVNPKLFQQLCAYKQFPHFLGSRMSSTGTITATHFSGLTCESCRSVQRIVFPHEVADVSGGVAWREKAPHIDAAKLSKRKEDGFYVKAQDSCLPCLKKFQFSYTC